jgi:hypothetical protein
MLLWRDIDGTEIEQVRIRIVAVDFEDFGNESPARPSFDMNHDVDRIADVRFNGAVRQLNAALQNATREPRQALLGGTGVNRGQRSGVAGVEKLQEVKRLAGTDFADIRTGYACGWCQIENGILTLIPHPDSGEPTRTFRHPNEVEVVGRVTGIAMRIGEESQTLMEAALQRKSPPKK